MAEPASVANRTGERVGVVVIHGVGETEPGWINASLVPQLEKRADDLSFERHSKVFSLPDRGRRKPNARFNVYLRRGEFSSGGPRFALIECFWADLSKVGTGPISTFLAMMRLFYEAPQVLGHAALMRSRKGGALWVRRLTLFANWLLRWPITGLNTAALFCALVILGRARALEIEGVRSLIPDLHLSFLAGAVLAALAGLSLWIGKAQEHRDITLSDIAKSTALFSVVLLALVVIGSSLYPDLTAKSFEPYLAVTALITLAFWFAWNHAVIAAILVLAWLYAKRLVSRGDGQGVSLNRPAAALGLTIFQGVVWKIVIALLWLLLFLALAPESFSRNLKCPSQWYNATCILKDINSDLFNVVLFNIGTVIALTAAFLGVASWRAAARRLKRKTARDAALKFPRLIVSPVITVLIFALALFNFYSFYALVYQKGLESLGFTFDLPIEPYKFVGKHITIGALQESMKYIGGATVAIYIYARIIRAVQDASRGVLHIARDIVDHQYSPRAAAVGLWRAMTPKPGSPTPRRNRIEHRLDALMKDVVTAQRFDRLVFVAHSQGTVILYDYLISGRDNESIQGVSRIDVVTLASPLTHLYRHYFDDYDKVLAPAFLHERLASWTNLWRLDDPIGQEVDMFVDGFTKNEVLPNGGHVDYWREPRVCELILALIDPARQRDEGEDALPPAAA